MPRNPNAELTASDTTPVVEPDGPERSRPTDAEQNDTDVGGSPGGANVPFKGPWIVGLEKLYGTIPNIEADNFQQAFAKARQQLDAGKIFMWQGKAYSTNTEAEGLLKGLAANVQAYIQKR